MKNLPLKRHNPRCLNCQDCKEFLTDKNKKIYLGHTDKRCVTCYRKYHNEYNKKRAKRIKESKWF
jgi:hypothetical protein